MDLSIQEIFLRLCLATILSGVIGIEREIRKKPAGVRTNALIGLGSAVMSLAGVALVPLFPGSAIDPGRLASIVIQGVGFIGAGTIIQASGSVHGLTTAATIWAVAGIGIAVGLGLYPMAIVTTGIVLVLLAIFGPLDARLMGDEVGGEEKKKKFGRS